MFEVELAEIGLTKEGAVKWGRETMLDGNPSVHLNPFAGNKIKYELGDPVMIVKYHEHPDICGVVTSAYINILKITIVETGEQIWIRKDGVSKIETDDHWLQVKSIQESIHFYEPRRQHRSSMIDIGIMIGKFE